MEHPKKDVAPRPGQDGGAGVNERIQNKATRSPARWQTKTGKVLSGLAAFLEAVAASKLTTNQKLLVNVMVRKADWDTGWRCRMRIKDLAEGISRGPTTTRDTIDQLERLGVLILECRSVGGRSCTHEWNINFAALMSMQRCVGVASRSEPTTPESPFRNPFTSCSETLQRSYANPPSLDTPLKEIKDQSTTTKRGGGGTSEIDGTRSETGETHPTGSVSATVLDRLRKDIGVSNGVALELAGRHTLEEVEVAVRLAKRCRDVKSHAGLVVRFLRDGTAQLEVEGQAARVAAQNAKARRAAEREHVQVRFEAGARRVQQLLDTVMRDGHQRPSAEQMRIIKRGWPTAVSAVQSVAVELLESNEAREAFASKWFPGLLAVTAPGVAA